MSCAKRFWTRRSEPGGAPSEVSVEPAPGVSLSLSAQGRKRGKRRGGNLKAKLTPKHLSTPASELQQAQGAEIPDTLGF